MGLVEKIEAIKRQPEHVRLRYVWLSVFVSMVFIISLWIFSLQVDNKNKTESLNQIVNLEGLGAEIEQQKNTAQQTVKDIQDSSAGIEAEMRREKDENIMNETLEK